MRHALATPALRLTTRGGVIGIGVPVVGLTTTTGTCQGPGWPT